MTASCSAEPAGGPPAVIEVTDLTRDFGATRALDGASFAVRPGEIFGLLGPNGAGKTTAIRILLTLLRPTAGEVRVAGTDVASRPVAVRRLVGWVPQERAVDPLLTARENLRFIAGLYHLGAADRHRRAAELLALVELTEHADRLVRDYSGGMRRRLELAMGMVHVPAVLVLDEPTLGLDLASRRRLWRQVRRVRATGTTVLLTTHYLDEADLLCDRVALIDKGQIRAVDTPARLKRRYGQSSLDDVLLAVTGP
ncbi:MAG: ATP-binding cassette domain-containing protein [Micromonosporaceae bacterium]|nr:ATP-binding cassette domain-containing protein [Micromonosporaceae bacterium]